MRIAFDPSKDRVNRRKHGMSLKEAERLDWETAVIWEDDRFEYGELRMRGWGMIGADLFHVVFVDRDDVRRVISLRSAEKQEFKRYVRYFERWS